MGVRFPRGEKEDGRKDEMTTTTLPDARPFFYNFITKKMNRPQQTFQECKRRPAPAFSIFLEFLVDSFYARKSYLY